MSCAASQGRPASAEPLTHPDLVQDPAAPALPPLHKIITSTVPDTYDASNLIERLRNPAAAAYDPRSPDFDPEVAGRWKDNDNYPDVPRLVVLSSEEAETVIPRSGEAMGREHGWWPAVDGRHGVDAVTVLDGTTVGELFCVCKRAR